VKIACHAIRPWLAAHLDREETAKPSELIQEHLAECVECRRLAENQRALSRALSGTGLAEPSAELLGKVSAATRRDPRRLRRALVGAAVACAVAVLVTVLVLRRTTPAEPRPLADIAVLYLRSVAAGQTPLDIVSADPAKLVEWFAGRLPFELLLPRLDSPELHLVGSRLVDVGGRLAAFIAYRRGDVDIGLAVAQQGDVPPPRSTTSETFRSIRFHFETVDGYEVISWSDRGLSYSLASRLPSRGRASCQVCHSQGSGLADVQEFHR
jgi:anti-sigma factor RsiW